MANLDGAIGIRSLRWNIKARRIRKFDLVIDNSDIVTADLVAATVKQNRTFWFKISHDNDSFS